MAKSRSLTVVIAGDAKPFQRALVQSSTSADHFGRKMGGVSSKVGMALKGIAIGGAGAAGLGIGTMVKAGVAYEKQMAKVAGVSSATGKEMKSLGGLAKQLGADTKFSAGEAAEAMYELSSAGFKVGEMSKVLPGTLSLAAASGIELKDAAEISANALRGFGLDASKMGHVGDVLAQAVNSSSVEMTDLQNTMKYIGPIARTTGQSFEDMIAAVSLMGDAGIKGEQAGTTLRGALTRLTNPTKSVSDGLKSMGLKAQDLYGPNGLKPLPKILDLMSKGTADLTKYQRNQALASVFGTEALSGMATVMDAGVPKLRENAKALRESEGAAKRAADTMNDTVAGAWDSLTGSVETASITLYEKFAPALKETLKGAATGINALPGFATKAKDAVSGLVDRFKLLRDAQDASGKTGAGAAIGTMLADGVAAIDWGSIGKRISAGLSGALDLGSDLKGAVSSGISAAFANVDGAELAGGLLRVVSEAMNALSDPGFWKAHWEQILTAALFIIPIGRILKIPGATHVANFLGRSFNAGFQFFGRGFTSLTGRVGRTAGFRFLVELEKVAPRTASFLLNLVTGSARRLGRLPGALATVASRAVNAVADRLGNGIGRVAGVVARWVVAGDRALNRGIGAFTRGAVRLAGGVIRGLNTRLGGVPGTIAKALAAGVARLAAWVANFARGGARIGKGIIDGIVSAVRAGPGQIAGAVGGAVTKGLGAAGGAIKGALGKLKDAVGDGVGQAVAGVGTAGVGSVALGSAAAPGSGAGLNAWNKVGQSFGLTPGSGIRNSITLSGNPSLHNSGKARDFNGSMQAMRNFAVHMKRTYGSRLLELISPWRELNIKNGQPYSYSPAVQQQHSGGNAHVHVASGDGDGVERERGPRVRGPQGDGDGVPILDLARRVWKAQAPLMGARGMAAPILRMVKGLRYSGLADQSTNTVKLDANAKLDNYAKNTLVHEFAHMRQSLGLSDQREIEGGASLFANRFAPRIYRALGISFRNTSRSTDPYAAQMKWTERNRSLAWVRSGQFMGEPGKRKGMARPSQLSGQQQIIRDAAKRHGIDPSILWGLYGAETNFGKNTNSSSAGAQGPFQFMPATARAYGIDPHNFGQAANAAAKYLATYEGRGVAGMLSAYNAGPGGNPNNPETRAYIPKVQSLAKTWPGDAGEAPDGPEGASRARKRGGRITGPAASVQAAKILEFAQKTADKARVTEANRIKDNAALDVASQYEYEGATLERDLGRAGNTKTSVDDRAVRERQRRYYAARQRAIKERMAKIKRSLRTSKAMKPGTRKRLLDERQSLLQEATQLGASQSEVGTALYEIDNPAQEEVEVDPGPTQYDRIEAWAAEASLTAGDEDDRAAAQARADILAFDLQNARDSGDPRRIAEAAGNYKSAREALEQFNEAAKAAAEAAEAQARAQEEHTNALKSVAEEMKRQNDIASQVMSISAREAVRALADTLSGHIAGPMGFGGRSMTAGDGVTRATYGTARA